MKTFRRHKLFVNAKLQGALLAHAILYWFYCLVSVAVLAMIWIVIAETPLNSASLLQQLWNNCGPALIGSVVLLPLVLLDCLRLSNRFAGPMVRFQRAIKDLADGKSPRQVHLRDGDFWMEFAADMNRLIEQSAPAATPTTSEPVVMAVEANPVPAEDAYPSMPV